MRNRFLSCCTLAIVAGVAMGLSGCGDSGTGMSAQDEANAKAHDASKMVIPPGAKMAPGADFKSSISDGPHPGGGAGVPGSAAPDLTK